VGNTEDSLVRRRSLRILAREKLKEDQLTGQSGDSLSNKSGNCSTEAVTREREGEGVSERRTSKRKQKSQSLRKSRTTLSLEQKRSPSPVLRKKRKQSCSPSVSSPPSKKSSKKSPVKNRIPSRESRNTATDSANRSALDKGEGEKRTQPGKKEVSQKGREGRDSVIVYLPKKGKRKGQSVKHTAADYSETDTEVESSGKRVRPKRRRSKGKGAQSREGQGSTSKGKGKSAWDKTFSLPSLVEFARLNMASPE
jgi:hypothetical protein